MTRRDIESLPARNSARRVKIARQVELLRDSAAALNEEADRLELKLKGQPVTQKERREYVISEVEKLRTRDVAQLANALGYANPSCLIAALKRWGRDDLAQSVEARRWTAVAA